MHVTHPLVIPIPGPVMNVLPDEEERMFWSRFMFRGMQALKLASVACDDEYGGLFFFS